MTKKHFIALADAISEHNRVANHRMKLDYDLPIGTMHHGEDMHVFTQDQLDTLADFCRSTNSNFMRDRWLGYIAGENGKNGGKVGAR